MNHNHWPTEEQDLTTAADIIDKHVLRNEGQPLDIMKVFIDKGKTDPVNVEVSAWVLEMIDHFREQYGYEHGHAVMGNILTKILLQHEIIH